MRKVIRRRIEEKVDGANIVGHVNAVVAANVDKGGEKTSASSKSHIRVVQRDGRTHVFESIGDDGSPTPPGQ